MTSHATTQRPEPARSATWPSADMQTSQSVTTPTENQAFNDDLEQHPERHFLSPMTAEEFYGWDSDSDDEDDDDGEWNAGITDFSLFAADRKRATESGEPLDEKWDSFVSHQTEAFERSVERMRESEDEIPALTPDASPNLRDDLENEDESDGGLVLPQMQMPNYLTVEVKPAGANSQRGFIVGPDDDLPLSFWFTRKKRIERPGLRHARTMSGRKHVWRRPDNDIFTVGEDVGAEEEAEREDDELKFMTGNESLVIGAK